MSPEMAKTGFWMLVNFVSCVWIIWSTKICFQQGFKFGTTLTALHFLMTYIGLEVSAVCGFFERKKLPLLGVLPLSIAFCGFIVFNNLSLQFNTIGMYQITKVLTTPVIVVIHMVFYSKWLTVSELLALVLVCVGVVVATEANLDLNTAGVVTGLLGVLSSSVYQIWVETKQLDFKCSPAQLLYYQAPISFLLLLPVIGVTESVVEMINFQFTWKVTAAIVGSGLLAFLLNLSTYIVIGSTSPLTYNMIGHSKLVIIILSSYLVFGERQSILGIAGVVCAVAGIVSYAQIRLSAKQAEQKVDSVEYTEMGYAIEEVPLIDKSLVSMTAETTADSDSTLSDI